MLFAFPWLVANFNAVGLKRTAYSKTHTIPFSYHPPSSTRNFVDESSDFICSCHSIAHFVREYVNDSFFKSQTAAELGSGLQLGQNIAFQPKILEAI